MDTAADNMTLAHHAEAWWRENGNTVPPVDTPEYEEMYVAWHGFAFRDFNKPAKRKGKV